MRAVENYLRKMIVSGAYPPGMKLPSDQDLAREFGVAYMTLRHAMEPLVRDGLISRHRGKGTFVAADAARAPRARSLALALPSVSVMWSVPDVYYLPGIVQAFCAEATRQGYEAAVLSGIEAAPLHAGQGGGDLAGAALLLTNESDYEAADTIAQSGLPLVTIHAYRGRRAIPSVQVRQAEGIAAAVNHLADLGHRRIAYLGGPAHNIAAESRHAGFRTALRAARLATAYADCEAGDYTDASGQSRAAALLSARSRPTAVVTAGDLIAAGVLRAAIAAGLRVPEDLSVTGFGDFYVAQVLQPPLTTARLPLAGLGRGAAELLARRIAGQLAVAPLLFDAELVVRGSTGPASD